MPALIRSHIKYGPPAKRKRGRPSAPAEECTARTARTAPADRSRIGVVERLIFHLRTGGGSVDELAAKLAVDFPERDAIAMRSTVHAQVSRLPVEKGIAINRETIAGLKKRYWIS